MKIGVIGQPDCGVELFMKAFGICAGIIGLEAETEAAEWEPAKLAEIYDGLCLFPPYDTECLTAADFADSTAKELGRARFAEFAGGRLLAYGEAADGDAADAACDAVSVFSGKTVKRQQVRDVRYLLSKAAEKV